jgi:hypothetical protein
MANVARPMSTSDQTSIDLRPRRSPKWPMTAPPSGSAMKPSANVAKAARRPAKSDTCGKNCGPNTTAAAVP